MGHRAGRTEATVATLGLSLLQRSCPPCSAPTFQDKGLRLAGHAVPTSLMAAPKLEEGKEEMEAQQVQGCPGLPVSMGCSRTQAQLSGLLPTMAVPAHHLRCAHRTWEIEGCLSTLQSNFCPGTQSQGSAPCPHSTALSP